MDNEEWMEKAKAAIESRTSNDAFKLRDLYSEHDWNTLSKGDRIQFGKFFCNEVGDGRVPGVTRTNEKGESPARYKKQ